MNTNAHRAPYRLIAAVIAITLSIFTASSCTVGNIPVEKLASTFQCNRAMELNEDMSLTMVAKQTLPEDAEISEWSSGRPIWEWRRLIAERSGVIGTDFKKDAVLQIPVRCSDVGAGEPDTKE